VDLNKEIGQHLIVGFPGTEMSPEFIESVKKYKIGNVILFAHNIKSEVQLKKLISNINNLIIDEVGIPPFITIDQEGGMVTRLGEDSINIPGAMALTATQNIDYLEKCIQINSSQLQALGINCNLAPVLDVNCNKSNPVIGVRSFSDKAEIVATMGAKVIREYEKNNLLCVAKHFPGHGDTSADSHLDLPKVEKSYKELEKTEFPPFKKAIEVGVPAIMTSHILYPSLDSSSLPATMSKEIITNFLRKKLDFKGLVFSDCMEMKAISNYYGTVNGIIAALKAGADLLFISHHPKIAIEACIQIEYSFDNGDFNKESWTDSLNRILDYKKKYIGSSSLIKLDKERDSKTVYNIRKASLTLVKGHRQALGSCPLFVSPPLFRATNITSEAINLSFAEEIGKLIKGISITVSSDPTEEEIKGCLEKVDKSKITSIVFGTYNAHLYKGQLKLVKAFREFKVPITVVALRNPYDLKYLEDVSDCSLAAYEYTKDEIKIIAEFLIDGFRPTGKLPVEI